MARKRKIEILQSNRWQKPRRLNKIHTSLCRKKYVTDIKMWRLKENGLQMYNINIRYDIAHINKVFSGVTVCRLKSELVPVIHTHFTQFTHFLSCSTMYCFYWNLIHMIFFVLVHVQCVLFSWKYLNVECTRVCLHIYL